MGNTTLENPGRYQVLNLKRQQEKVKRELGWETWRRLMKYTSDGALGCITDRSKGLDIA